MPHCILEASANLVDQPDWGGLPWKINAALAATGQFQTTDINSRFIQHAVFAIGDGAPNQAFVTLDGQLLAGRTDEEKGRLSELPLLAEAFPETLRRMTFSLTVQISDLHRPSYRRYISY